MEYLTNPYFILVIIALILSVVTFFKPIPIGIITLLLSIAALLIRTANKGG